VSEDSPGSIQPKFSADIGRGGMPQLVRKPRLDAGLYAGPCDMAAVRAGIEAVIVGFGAFTVRPGAITAAQRGFTGLVTPVLGLDIGQFGLEAHPKHLTPLNLHKPHRIII
jgi:hypothetical protein